jgi:tetratricopeptide (TPR) repeat protein
MLYSIIPPLIIILSIVGIILFLVKKNPAVKELRRRENLNLNANEKKENISDNRPISDGIFTKINRVLLVILEKMIKQIQLLFLKSENKFKILGESIRKRGNVEKGDENAKLFIEGKEALDGIVDGGGKIMQEKNNLREKMFLRQQKYQEETTENFFRPIISDRIVVPKRRSEVKDRLEELLIERIAANPKDIEAYERLGEYYMEIKNLDYAKECFKQVLKLNPSSSNIRYKMRKLERMLKK